MFGLMKKSVHRDLLAITRMQRDAETKRANDLAALVANANDRLAHMAGIERYAASLKPDALKYRARLDRDRQTAAAKRKAKGGESEHG